MPNNGSKEITVKIAKSKLRKGSKIDLSEAVKMRLRGLSMSEIAAQFGCTKSAVSQAISRWCPEASNVDVYRNNEADLISSKKSMILNAITPEKVADATAFQLTGMFGIMVDKSRLVEGKSTANIESVINSAMNLANEKDGI